MQYKMISAAIVTLATLLLAGPVSAFHRNEPQNASEWQAVPEYCRARYIYLSRKLNVPVPHGWERTVSRASIEKWASTFGELWIHIHHFCRGQNLLNRYRRAIGTKEAQRGLLAKEAVSEITYVYRRTPTENPFKSVIAGSLGLAHHYAGNNKASLEILAKAIADHPAVVEPYSAAYIIYRELGRKDEALRTLETCYENTEGASAENNYFLALEYLNREKYDLARERADRAAELGYPLTGVQRRLKALGK